MKKLVLILLVVALALPVMAATISVVDNTDGTGTIQLTVTGTEVVRGVAIIVDAGAGAVVSGGVSGVDLAFNVFLDQAFTTYVGWVEGDPLRDVIGVGSPVADPQQDPAVKGVMGLPSSKITLCMGILDESGATRGADVTGGPLENDLGDGVYDIATVDLGAAGAITVTADVLRGGVVGNDGENLLGATTYPVGAQTITMVSSTCVGNVTGIKDGFGVDEWWSPIWDAVFDSNTKVDTSDLTAMVNVLVNENTSTVPGTYEVSPVPANLAAFNITGIKDGFGVDEWWSPIWDGVFDTNTAIDTSDLTALVNILVNENTSTVPGTYEVDCPW